MEHLFYIGAHLLGLCALLLISQLAARLLWWALRDVLRFKPFNCDACLTFWLTLIVFALWHRDAPASETARFALTFAFINYF